MIIADCWTIMAPLFHTLVNWINLYKTPVYVMERERRVKKHFYDLSFLIPDQFTLWLTQL